MEHGFLDKFSERDSVIHRLDPRGKFIASLALIVALTQIDERQVWLFLPMLVAILVPILLGKIPILFILRKSLVLVPMVVMVAIFLPFFRGNEMLFRINLGEWYIPVWREGVFQFALVVAKAFLAFFALATLTATTPFSRLLAGWRRLGLPRALLAIMSFMYRYIFLLIDEGQRLQRARLARSCAGHTLLAMRAFSNQVGVLFIRSYERGERTYLAMKARGFDGAYQKEDNLKFRWQDGCYLSGYLLLSSLVVIIAHGAINIQW
jgi:cobalt/nickel transport system permease protein